MLRPGRCLPRFPASPQMAASLILDAHGRAMRDIADLTGKHHQGLRSAAAHLRREGAISSGLAKKLTRLDDAACVTRHITSVSVATLLQEVSASLASHAAEQLQQQSQIHPSSFEIHTQADEVKLAELNFCPDLDIGFDRFVLPDVPSFPLLQEVEHIRGRQRRLRQKGVRGDRGETGER